MAPNRNRGRGSDGLSANAWPTSARDEWGDLSHGPDPVHAADEVSQRELGVRVRVSRIERERLLEKALRPVPRIQRELGKVRPAAQK